MTSKPDGDQRLKTWPDIDKFHLSMCSLSLYYTLRVIKTHTA